MFTATKTAFKKQFVFNLGGKNEGGDIIRLG